MNKIRVLDIIIGTILVSLVLIGAGLNFNISWLSRLCIGSGIVVLLFGIFISIKIARLQESKE